MVGERYVPEVLLTPSCDVPDIKVEDFPTATKVTTCQAKTATVDPSKDNDDINIEEDSTIIRPTKPSHVDFDKSKTKEDTLRYLTGLDILTTLTKFD
jgi:hypothetical protein